MVIHGLLQHARLSAERTAYRVCRAGHGFAVIRFCRTGEFIVGTFANEHDAVDWVADKLPRPARTRGDLIRS